MIRKDTEGVERDSNTQGQRHGTRALSLEAWQTQERRLGSDQCDLVDQILRGEVVCPENTLP
jgi:hypothetical protein